MAFTTLLDAAQTKSLAGKLGVTIGRFHQSWFQNGNAELGESFELYMLGSDVVDSPQRWTDELRTLLDKTDLWQHQVSRDGEPIALAQSVLRGDGERCVATFLRSARAKTFAEAISKLDRERVNEDTEVLLVAAPARQVDFFVLRSATGMEVLLIASTSASKDLVEGRYYTFHEFLRLLSAVPQRGGLRVL